MVVAARALADEREKLEEYERWRVWVGDGEFTSFF